MKKEKSLTLENIQKLLDEQTKVVIGAVDEKLSKTDVKIVQLDARLAKRMEQMEIRISQKIEKLTTTLDGFLKRMTDMETEFEMMKADLNRVKAILREKLNIAIE